MSIIDQIKVCHDEVTTWRRHFHAYSEKAFQEIRAANFVAIKLAGFDLAVHRGIAKSDVVGTLFKVTGGWCHRFSR